MSVTLTMVAASSSATMKLEDTAVAARRAIDVHETNMSVSM